MTANVTENSVKQEQIVKNVVFIFSFLLLELPDSEKIDKGLKSHSVVTLMSWILTLRTYVDVCTSDSHIFGKVPSTKVQRIICCLLSTRECSSCFSTDLFSTDFFQAVLILVRYFLISFLKVPLVFTNHKSIPSYPWFKELLKIEKIPANNQM